MFINSLFLVEVVYNKDNEKYTYYLRTNDGRILFEKDKCDFSDEISSFVNKVLNVDKQ